MRVLLLTPWANAWVPYLRDAFEKRGATFALAKAWNQDSKHDVVVHGWATSQPVPNSRNVMFLRRFELFDGALSKVNWKGIDKLICVNTWIAERVRDTFKGNGVKTSVDVIYNGTDLNKWAFRPRKAGKRIGMACHVHPKKNLPLALQILSTLPEGYELHIAGAIQDSCTAEYLNHLGKQMRKAVYLYDQIPHNEIDGWWDHMDYCLSTSLSEGNPNNVIEAMAKGIKPLVHDWPGSQDQFGPWIFKDIAGATAEILYGEYDSASYRQLVEERFSLKNIEKVVDLALEGL